MRRAIFVYALLAATIPACRGWSIEFELSSIQVPLNMSATVVGTWPSNVPQPVPFPDIAPTKTIDNTVVLANNSGGFRQIVHRSLWGGQGQASLTMQYLAHRGAHGAVAFSYSATETNGFISTETPDCLGCGYHASGSAGVYNGPMTMRFTVSEPGLLRVRYAARVHTTGVGGSSTDSLVSVWGNSIGSGSTLAVGPDSEYILQFHFPRAESGLTDETGAASKSAVGAASLFWTLDDFYLSSPGKPLVGITGHDAVVLDTNLDPPPASDPHNIAGVQLTAPISGDFGITSNFFVGLSTDVDEGPAAGARLTGYQMRSEFSPVRSLVFPSLPTGAQDLRIAYGDQIVNVLAGEEIHFGPSGVNEFTIAGFDPAAAGGVAPDLVFGLKFAEEGVASLVGVGALYSPPGDYDDNGFVDGHDFLTWQRSLGSIPDLGTGADGTADGIVDHDDLEFWRGRFGDPGSVAAGSVVPEPISNALVALAALLTWDTRRRLPAIQL